MVAIAAVKSDSQDSGVRGGSIKGILVLDFGSQYTLLIARRLREMGVYAEVHDPANLMHETLDLKHLPFDPVGVILSGGPDSVGAQGARSMPRSHNPRPRRDVGCVLTLTRLGGK